MKSAAIFDRCVHEAEQVHDIEGFKDWTRGTVRILLPHGALACGHGRIHSAGVSMDYVVTVDYPTEHLRSICNSAGSIDTPLMRRWLMQRTPVFFDADAPWPDVDDRWLQNFRNHGLRNAAVDAVLDECCYVGTYFSFHALPEIDCNSLIAVFAKLTPLLHSTLMQVIATVPATGAGVPQRFSLLTAREREIADYISNGKSNSEIAKLLSVSENTIRNHVSRILDKTGCGNRAGLARLVAQQASMLYGMGTKVL